jgi:hypothetical protein
MAWRGFHLNGETSSPYDSRAFNSTHKLNSTLDCPTPNSTFIAGGPKISPRAKLQHPTSPFTSLLLHNGVQISVSIDSS